MAKDKRATLAVSKETAVRVQAVADAAGMSVGDLLRLASMERELMITAALEGLVRESTARLEKARKRVPGSAIQSAPPAAASARPPAPQAAPAASAPSAPARKSAPPNEPARVAGPRGQEHGRSHGPAA